MDSNTPPIIIKNNTNYNNQFTSLKIAKTENVDPKNPRIINKSQQPMDSATPTIICLEYDDGSNIRVEYKDHLSRDYDMSSCDLCEQSTSTPEQLKKIDPGFHDYLKLNKNFLLWLDSCSPVTETILIAVYNNDIKTHDDIQNLRLLIKTKACKHLVLRLINADDEDDNRTSSSTSFNRAKIFSNALIQFLKTEQKPTQDEWNAMFGNTHSSRGDHQLSYEFAELERIMSL